MHRCFRRNKVGADFVTIRMRASALVMGPMEICRYLLTLPTFRTKLTKDGEWEPAPSKAADHLETAETACVSNTIDAINRSALPAWRVVATPGDESITLVASLWYADSSQWTHILGVMAGEPATYRFTAESESNLQDAIMHFSFFLCLFALLASTWALLSPVRPKFLGPISALYLSLMLYQLGPILKHSIALPGIGSPASCLSNKPIHLSYRSDEMTLQSLSARIKDVCRVDVAKRAGIDPCEDAKRFLCHPTTQIDGRVCTFINPPSGDRPRSDVSVSAGQLESVLWRIGCPVAEPAWRVHLSSLHVPRSLFPSIQAGVTTYDGQTSICLVIAGQMRRLCVMGDQSKRTMELCANLGTRQCNSKSNEDDGPKPQILGEERFQGKSTSSE